MRDTVIYNQNFKTGERFEEHIQKNGILTKIEVDVIDNKTGEVIETAYTENDINYSLFNKYHPGYRSLINNVKMDTVQKVNPHLDNLSARIELWDSDDTSPEQQIFNRQLIGWAGKEVTYSGNSNKQGTYNNAESIKNCKSQSSTFVYDWPTHAANGTFNTICYTPAVSDYMTGLSAGAYYKDERMYYVPVENQAGNSQELGVSCLISAYEGKLEELGGCPHLILGDEAFYFLWKENKREYLSFKKYNFKTNSEITTWRLYPSIDFGTIDFDPSYEKFKIAYDYSDKHVYAIFYNTNFTETSKIDIYKINLETGDTEAKLVASPTLRRCLPSDVGLASSYTTEATIFSIEWFNGYCKIFHSFGSNTNVYSEAIFDPYTETLLDYYTDKSEKWRYVKKLGKLTTFNNSHIFNMNTLKVEHNAIATNIRSSHYENNYTHGYIENNRNTVIQWDVENFGQIPRNSVTEFLYSGVFSLAKLSKPVTKTPDNTLKVKYTFKIEKVYPSVSELSYVGPTGIIVKGDKRIESVPAIYAAKTFEGFTKESNGLKPITIDNQIESSIDSLTHSRYTITKEQELNQSILYNNRRGGLSLIYGNAPGVDVSEALAKAYATESNYFHTVNRAEGFYVSIEKQKACEIVLKFKGYLHNYGGAGQVSVHVTNSKVPPEVNDENSRVYFKDNQGNYFDETAYLKVQLQPGKNYIHFRVSKANGYHSIYLYDIYLTPEYKNIDRQKKAILINSEGKLIKRSIQDAGFTLKEFKTRFIRVTLDGYATPKESNNTMNYIYGKVGDVVVSLDKKTYTITEDDYEIFPYSYKYSDSAYSEALSNGIDSATIDLEAEYNLDIIRGYLSNDGGNGYAKLEVSTNGKDWYIVRHCDDQAYPLNLGELPGTTPLKKYVWTTQDITDLESDLETHGTVMMGYDVKNYLAATEDSSVDIFRYGQYGTISDIRYAKKQMIEFNNCFAEGSKKISGFSLKTDLHPKSIYYIVSFDDGATWKTIVNGAFVDTEYSYESIYNSGIRYNDSKIFTEAINKMEQKSFQIKVTLIVKNVVYNANKSIEAIRFFTV